TLSDGTPYWEWRYQEVWPEIPIPPPLPGGIEDTPHGQFTLGSLAVILEDQIRLNALLARAGRSERVPLSPRLFVRFANTFLRKIWRHDVLSEYVDGTGDENFTEECAGFIPLAQFDPWVWKRS